MKRALDLFCGAGGATKGLQRAGFHVTGVDINPQPRYCGDDFILGRWDVMGMAMKHFDLIWASPPCQAHVSLRWMHNAKTHHNHIPEVRSALKMVGVPFVIENVPDTPLESPLTLCGTMFGLGIKGADLRRHRIFESSFMLLSPRRCTHVRGVRVIGVYGGHGRDRRRNFNAQNFSVAERRQAMGIDWMNGTELSQAIPPAYSEYIGKQFMEHLS